MNGTEYILVNRRQMEFIRTLKIISPSSNSSEYNSINPTNRPIFMKFSVYICIIEGQIIYHFITMRIRQSLELMCCEKF